MVDRRKVADKRAMAIVLGYEQLHRDPVFDVHEGLSQDADRIREAASGIDVKDVRLSADVVAGVARQARVIEVKSRGSKGPIHVLDRQKWTFETLGDRAWLYVVWNVTQPSDYELWAVQDPNRMPWVITRPNERERGTFRGVQHEAIYKLTDDDINRLGTQLDLTGVTLPPKE